MRPGLSRVVPPHWRPSLRLSSLWLEQLGFAIGSKVKITACAGALVVSVMEACVPGHRSKG
ncbi:SymE family type I addiction module toxin [Xanthomonas sp. CFBP 8703]|uniref:SymE family type I addiction module toxin n=1 Tax=Xanthomonas bonasiae TaxID=2810351 RepID=A0ABS3B994_9XANT|nr:SymE family type I addiction module toxin [Xanthomonas bonasiae]